jgi:hypothetical protein
MSALDHVQTATPIHFICMLLEFLKASWLIHNAENPFGSTIFNSSTKNQLQDDSKVSVHWENGCFI